MHPDPGPYLKLLGDVLPEILGSVVLWLVLGALVGGGLGIAGYFVGARARAWRFEWRHAKWIRGVAAVWLVLSIGGLGGAAGGCEGAYRGVEGVLRKSEFRRDQLVKMGGVVASLLYYVDLELANLEASRPANLTPGQQARVTAFAEGRIGMNVTAFAARVERAREEGIRQATDRAVAYVREKLSIPESAFLDSALRAFTGVLVLVAARKAAREHLEEYGLNPFTFLDGMKEVAAASGDPGDATLLELSNHVVDAAFIPLVLHPAKGYVRGHQMVLGIVALGAACLPLLLFWGLRRFVQPRIVPSSPGLEESAPRTEETSGPPSGSPPPKPE